MSDGERAREREGKEKGMLFPLWLAFYFTNLVYDIYIYFFCFCFWKFSLVVLLCYLGGALGSSMI